VQAHLCKPTNKNAPQGLSPCFSSSAFH